MENSVLVVDDEEATRRSLGEILRLEGCTVQTAASGEQALDWLRRDTFAVLLLDLKMPGIDGLDVLRVAARLAPDTHIILLTAHGSLESAIEALRYGAHDYLLKPSSPAQIVQSVKDALQKLEETRRKRTLLDHLDASLRELRGMGAAPDFTGTDPKGMTAPRLVHPQGFVFDTERREISQGEMRVSLTPTEGKLLRILWEAPGRVFSPKELVQSVQGYEVNEWEAPEVLRPLVSRLRHKLSAFPNGENLVVNVRGSGYTFGA
jgi:DNA-binding response OmpR family regulator